MNDSTGPGAPEPEQDLESFIARIRRGDESAARELLARYEAQVRLVVRRQLPRLLRSRFDSLDFLQSVWGSFFRQMQAGSDFEQPQALVAFLAQVARNKVIDEYRRASSQKGDMNREEPLWTREAGPLDLISTEDSPESIAEARETLAKLQGMLPEDRRNVIELRIEGLSTREIGARLDLSERTVRRILEDLRNRAADLARGDG